MIARSNDGLASADDRCAVIVMAKAPRPGLAKTRLIPALGADDAARLARWLLDRTLQLRRSLPTSARCGCAARLMCEIQPSSPGARAPASNWSTRVKATSVRAWPRRSGARCSGTRARC